MLGTQHTIVELADKIKLIESQDKDGSLVFKPPSPEALYTIPELKTILRKLIGIKIPKGTIVQRKHWVTYEVLKLLGYKKPSGLRTKEAKQNKPKFKHQLMDIFVQKHSNLQIWNYIPYTVDRYDCRYVIFKVDDEKIIGFTIKTGKELKDWDTTGTKTIKWQAIVGDKTRKDASSRVLLSKKDPIFTKFGLGEKNLDPIEIRIKNIKKLQIENYFLLKSRPNQNLLITIKELGVLLEPLINVEIKYTSEKLIGQAFQRLVARELGYSLKEGFSINSGQTPDMIHQLIETKLQMSPTIDLGFHLPVSNKPLRFDWNKNNLTPRDIRYVIALADKIAELSLQIRGIIVVSGEEFEKFFSLCEGTNFKVQMTIPNFDSI